MAQANRGDLVAQPTPIAVASMRKAVNIVAMGSSHQDFMQAQMMEHEPEMLKDAETWTINYMGAAIPCDRVIHVDPVWAYTGHPPVRKMLDFALKQGIPVYTSWPHPHYPNHVLYPFDKVLAYCGMPYFNTSVAYAICLAMAEGYNEIGLFGCDFSYPNVHVSESGRACCEFWMGWGSQRGVRFAVSKHSTLLDMSIDQQPYGFFANPHQPPNNGGKLMNVQQIFEHIARSKEPPRPVLVPLTPSLHPASTYTAPMHVVTNAPRNRGNGLDTGQSGAPLAQLGKNNEASDLRVSNGNV